MTGLILGVDPGLSGALAFYGPADYTLRIVDIPTHTLKRNGKEKREVDIYELARLIDEAGSIARAFIEQVGAMPGQGVSSVFSFGKTYGQIIGVLAANFIPMEFVTPQTWKKGLKVPAAKDGSRARASQLLPHNAAIWSRAKDDGRAEAAMIALWGAGGGKS
jgi:crossover junction endodeoxyribonuclease RuvC